MIGNMNLRIIVNYSVIILSLCFFVFSGTVIFLGNSAANSNPEIVQVHPITNTIIINETESIAFSVEAVDRDGDILKYRWELTNINTKSTKIVSQQHTYTYVTDYTSAGVYVLNLTVEDVSVNSSEVHREWDITVMETNRPPVIDIIEPINPDPRINHNELLDFQVGVSDPDPDEVLIITWYLDGEKGATGPDTYTFVPSSYAEGRHVIAVGVDDGKEVTYYSWNVTVIEKPVVESSEGLTWEEWTQIGYVLLLIIILLTVIVIIVGVKGKKNKGK